MSMQPLDTPGALEHAIRRDLARGDGWEAWLVYADWLSAHGDARGRLIGLEHHLAIATLSATERAAIQTEIDALIEAHEQSWQFVELPETCALQWRHGFPIAGTFGLAQADLDALATVLADPRARLLSNLRVRLTPDEDYDGLDDYDGEGEPAPAPVPEESFAALFELDFSQIHALAIEYTSVGRFGAELLASCSSLAQLEVLDLRYAALESAGVKALFGGRTPWKLTSLKLQRNRIAAAGAKALASAVQLQHLRTLDLRDNPIGPVGAKALANSRNLGRLESLYLYYADVDMAGARALSLSDHLPVHIRRYWAGQSSAAHAPSNRTNE